jgi:cytochrome c
MPHTWRRLLSIPLCLSAGICSASGADAEKGKVLFEQCAACHSLEAGKSEVGPSLHGLFGRRSASEDFNYSPAMRRANIVWTPESLDAYLANQQAGVFRGNRMPFSGIPDAQARGDLITFLEQATR